MALRAGRGRARRAFPRAWPRGRRRGRRQAAGSKESFSSAECTRRLRGAQRRNPFSRMIPRILTRYLAIATGLFASLVSVPTVRAVTHDLYVCAAFNNGSRVMGSRDGSANGVFKLMPGGFEHLGINY